MKGRRSLAVLALTAPLVLVGLASAPAALASGSFTSATPAEGAVLGSNRFTVEASIAANSSSATLTVTGRDSDGTTLCTAKASSAGGAFSSSQTLTLTFPSGVCGTTRNARWTATLSGGATGTRTFSTNAAPATPSGFAAAGEGARDVTFQWDMGTEPDLLGYVLYDGSGDVIDGDVSLSRCEGGACSYALYYPADNPGTFDYALAAKRSSAGCGSCGSVVLSGRATDSATLTTPPPPPSPTPDPQPTPTDGSTGGTTSGGTTTGGTTGSGGTTSGGTTGATTTGGRTGGTTSGSTGGTSVHPAPKPTLPPLPKNLAAQRRAFALSFNAFSPSLGIPKLPPLPATFAPTIGKLPLPMGTYNPTLPYKPQTEVIDRTSAIRQTFGVGASVDPFLLGRSIAVALILMLIAAHLRRFLGARHDG